MTQPNPQEAPIVTASHSLRPQTIVGNREVSPHTLQWVRLFSLPTNPWEAIAVALQWLFAAKVSIDVALVTPLFVQVPIVLIWAFLAGCGSLVAHKEPQMSKDILWVFVNVFLGFLLGVL